MFEKWIEDHREEIIAKTQGVLQINSVGGPESGPEEPFGPGCAEALRYVLALGEERGLTVKNVDGYAGHIEFGTGDEYIAVVGHLDVVPVGDGWTYPPFGGVIDDGKLYARGALDDKGPMMAALFGAFAVQASGLPLSMRVRVIFGLDEESNWRCMDHYFAKEPQPFGGFTPDADFPLIYAEKGVMCFDLTKPRQEQANASVVVRELVGGSRFNMVPDQCRVVLAVQEGREEATAAQIREAAAAHDVEVEIETKGRELTLFVKGVSAHAAIPHTGVNAVVKAASLLKGLDTGEEELWTLVSEVDTEGERIGVKLMCPVTGPLTCNLGIARVDEGQAAFSFNLRFPVDKTFDDLYALMEEKLAGTGLVVSPSPDINMAPLHVPKDSEIVTKLLQVYEEATGEKAEPITIGGGTYARAIPNAVAFGPVFAETVETAHQKDEYWPVEDLIRCAKIYAKAIYELAK